MRALGRLPCLAVAFLLGGGVAIAREQAGKGTPARAVCEVDKVTSPQLDGPPETPRHFSAAQVSSLELAVQTPPAPKTRRGQPPAPQVELRLFTPQGHLYQTLRAASPAAEPGKGDVHARHQRVGFRLPVAGSPIVTNSLYGRWRAEPYLPGAETACGKARRFWITR